MVVLLAFAFQNRQFKPTKPGCGGIISHLLLPPDMHKARCCTLQKNCQIARVLNAYAHIAQQWDHKFCATLLPRYRNWPRTWKTIGEEVSFLSCKLFRATGRKRTHHNCGRLFGTHKFNLQLSVNISVRLYTQTSSTCLHIHTRIRK